MKNRKSDSPVAEFENYLNSVRHSAFKNLVIIGFCTVLILWILDHFLVPEIKLEKFLLYRAATAYGLLLQFFLLLVTGPSGYINVHGYFFSILTALMVSLMADELGGLTSGYFAGLFLVLLGVVVLVPFKLLDAAINSALILSIYLIVNLNDRGNAVTLADLSNLLLLVLVSFTALLYNFLHAQTIRRGYYAPINPIVHAYNHHRVHTNGLFDLHRHPHEVVVGKSLSASGKLNIADFINPGKL